MEYNFILEGASYRSDIINELGLAKKRIILQTYIFHFDDFGKKVLSILNEKSESNVEVFLLLDYWGCFFHADKIKQFLSKSKVKVKFFNPLSIKKTLLQGRRLHHKVISIDSSIVYLGGINVIDRKYNERLDFAVKCNGSLNIDLEEYLLDLYNENNSFVNLKKYKFENRSNDFQILVNDWLNNRKNITNSYINLIKDASEEIILIHGYFLPGLKVLNLIKEKAENGIRVVIVLPKNSDWRLWVHCTRYLYNELIGKGVEVREWHKSILHGKLGVFDRSKILVGSHNLNYMSSFGNLELNCILANKLEVNKNFKVIKSLLEQSEIVEKTSFYNHKLRKLKEITAFNLIGCISILSTCVISFANKISEVTIFRFLSFLILLFLGVLGVFLPFVPGILFISLAFIILFSEKRSSEAYD